MEKTKLRGGKTPYTYYGSIAKYEAPVRTQDEGKKNLVGKPEWSMVPMEGMMGVVRVFEHGSKAYGGRSTWLPGIKFGKLYSAICRHLFAWFVFGEDRDAVSGQHPLCHVIANCLMLLSFIHKEGFDDRKGGL